MLFKVTSSCHPLKIDFVCIRYIGDMIYLSSLTIHEINWAF